MTDPSSSTTNNKNENQNRRLSTASLANNNNNPNNAFERHLSGEPGMFVAIKEAAASFSDYDPSCFSLTCAHPALEPFPNFVCRVLNHPQDSLLGRVIENAASLYLFRNDPDSLRVLMEFWYHFKNFCDEQILPSASFTREEEREPTQTEKEIMDKRGQSREQLLQVVASGKFSSSNANNVSNNENNNNNNDNNSSDRSTPVMFANDIENKNDNDHNNSNNVDSPMTKKTTQNYAEADLASSSSAGSSSTETVADTVSPSLAVHEFDEFQLTEEERFEIFLATQMGVIQSCLEAYFSTDWHRQQDVMVINRQHRDFMKKRDWVNYLVQGYKKFRESCREVVLNTNITSEQERVEIVGETLGQVWSERNSNENNNNNNEPSSSTSSARGSGKLNTIIGGSGGASSYHNNNHHQRSFSNSSNVSTPSSQQPSASPVSPYYSTNGYPTLVPLPEERRWLDFDVVDPAKLRKLESDPTRSDSLLIIFHAAYSTPSTIFVNDTLVAVHDEIKEKEMPVRILIVNASVEINLLLEYEVEEFPSVFLIPPLRFGESRPSFMKTPSLTPAQPNNKKDGPSTSSPVKKASTAEFLSCPPPPVLSIHNSHHRNEEEETDKNTNNNNTYTTSNNDKKKDHDDLHRLDSTRPEDSSRLLGSTTLTLHNTSFAQLTLMKARRKKFPSNGVMNKNILLEWIQSDGTKAVPEKKLKKFVTKLVKLEQRLRFAPFRKLASAANTVRRLCSGGTAATCTPLKNLDASSSGATSAFPTTDDDAKSSSTGGSADHRHDSSLTAKDPRFIFLGGGAASGKSTAVMALKTSAWWEENHNNIVVVDADEFKRHDPLYKGNVSDLHEQSVSAAEFLLVSAVNEGRHIIFDSTMMWAPFVEQTVEMIRDSRHYVYEKGPGWQGADKPEIYWIKKHPRNEEELKERHPYSISIYGIFADPARSVPRCLVRELTSGRTMLVAVLLKSLKMFAQHFEDYCQLVDDAVLFDNNVFVNLEKGELPPTAAKKDSKDSPLEILEEASFNNFMKHRDLNPRAARLDDLYLKEKEKENGKSSK